MQKKTIPYEFLARFGLLPDGTAGLLGAHWQERIVVVDDDGVTVLSDRLGDAQPVALAGGAGFPLADALAALNTAAIARGDALQGQLDTASAGLAQATADLETRTKERDDARAEIERLNAALAEANAPLPANVLSSLDFFDRFSDQEYGAIKAAAAANVQIARWIDQSLAAQQINLADPRVQAGVNALAAAGLIAPSRAVEILKPA